MHTLNLRSLVCTVFGIMAFSFGLPDSAITTSNTIFAQERERIKDGYVAWRPISGARGYRVQIRPTAEPDRIVQDDTVRTTFVRVDLPVGQYQVRTTPLNDFGRITVWSEWTRLQILISRQPVLDAESDRQLKVNNRNKSRFRFALSGSNFFPNATRVVLRHADNQTVIPVENLEVAEDGKRLVSELVVGKASEGSYNLELINPFGKTLVRERFLEISNQREASTLSLDDYERYVEELTSSCGGQRLPDTLIKRCEEQFLVLNLSDRDRNNLYQYLCMRGDNYFERIDAYRYFAKVCPPIFEPGREYMRQRLESLEDGVDTLEKAHIERGLEGIEACQ